jgi:hypothetical protein
VNNFPRLLRNPNRVTSLKEIFNEEYELYQPKETYEYIFSKYKWLK